MLNQYQKKKHLNNPVTLNEIETAIKNENWNSFSAEFYQTFKEDLPPILLKLFPKI